MASDSRHRSGETRVSEDLRAILPLKRIRWYKLAIFVLALVLFLLALELMKAGIRGLAPRMNSLLRVDDPLPGLGFGWLSSYVVLSGSPIAAMALTFLDARVVDAPTAFTMIVGSRLGGSLIVLLIGLLYVLRGHERGTSLVTGLLALTITGTIYVPALPLGLLLLDLSLLAVRIDLPAGSGVGSFVDLILSAPVQWAQSTLPNWVVFLLGLSMTILSLSLIDKALPDFDLEDSVINDISRLLYRPWVVFVLGLSLTLVTMSVSVSLSLLIPLSVRGYIRRENLVPYIMGCNVSTFADTLLAALLLRNPVAAQVVLVQMVSILVVSLIILTLFFSTYQRLVLRVALWFNDHPRRLAAFFALVMLAPLAAALL